MRAVSVCFSLTLLRVVSCVPSRIRRPCCLWLPLPFISRPAAVCFYVGQNVEAVVHDFAASVDLVALEEDLVAEARRVLGKRVQEDGFIPPWKKLFGEPWVPSPAAAHDKFNIVPEIYDHDVAEMPGEEYATVVGTGMFHSLPPRVGGGPDAGPEAPLGTGRAGLAGLRLNLPSKTNSFYPASAVAMDANALPEGEEVNMEMPEEPVLTGWSARSYIQPAGYSADEFTIYSRGLYGAPPFFPILPCACARTTSCTPPLLLLRIGRYVFPPSVAQKFSDRHDMPSPLTTPLFVHAPSNF